MRTATLVLSFFSRSTAFCLTQKPRSFQSSSALHLNRFLLTTDEIDHADDGSLVAVLPKDDYRTIHAAKILGLSNGDAIRAGVVSCEEHNGLYTDCATVEWIPEGKQKPAAPHGNGKPPGSLSIQLSNLDLPTEGFDTQSVSLILALPRPLQLGRMLPMIAQMGVDKLILTHARKVPKDYFGSHLFRDPNQLTERLVEGLCQAGDVRLPEVQLVRNLGNFLDHDLDELFPLTEYARAIAHPQRNSDDQPALRIRGLNFPSESNKKVVVAVGPEGGWEEPRELDNFVGHGFQQVTMGARILRSDCAVVSLLGLAHDACHG